MNIFATIITLLCLFGLLPFVFLLTLKTQKQLKIAYIILLSLYVVVLLIGVFADVKIKGTIVIKSYSIPKDAKRFFNFTLITNKKRDFLINILMFIPFGFLLSALPKKFKILTTTSIGMLSSIFIEFVQYFLPTIRSAQLSDIILNTISCLIGSLLFVLIFHIKNRFVKHKKLQ